MKWPLKCDRCGTTLSSFSTSYFNTDTICHDCGEKERAHPEFEEARRIETEAVQRGDYNFPGVGLPADLQP